jgi:hypothetical protein
MLSFDAVVLHAIITQLVQNVLDMNVKEVQITLIKHYLPYGHMGKWKYRFTRL